jgi:hypothetical protein
VEPSNPNSRYSQQSMTSSSRITPVSSSQIDYEIGLIQKKSPKRKLSCRYLLSIQFVFSAVIVLSLVVTVVTVLSVSSTMSISIVNSLSSELQTKTANSAYNSIQNQITVIQRSIRQSKTIFSAQLNNLTDISTSTTTQTWASQIMRSLVVQEPLVPQLTVFLSNPSIFALSWSKSNGIYTNELVSTSGIVTVTYNDSMATVVSSNVTSSLGGGGGGGVPPSGGNGTATSGSGGNNTSQSAGGGASASSFPFYATAAALSSTDQIGITSVSSFGSVKAPSVQLTTQIVYNSTLIGAYMCVLLITSIESDLLSLINTGENIAVIDSDGSLIASTLGISLSNYSLNGQYAIGNNSMLTSLSSAVVSNYGGWTGIGNYTLIQFTSDSLGLMDTQVRYIDFDNKRWYVFIFWPNSAWTGKLLFIMY